MNTEPSGTVGSPDLRLEFPLFSSAKPLKSTAQRFKHVGFGFGESI